MDEARLQAALRRALVIAERGPLAGGNPRVGCVLLDADGAIVAEGHHRGAGTPHAEVDALAGAAGAAVDTAVVTLEPCAHLGRTGPCADALIAAGVRRVAYAVDDPADGAGGAARLSAAGVEVLGPRRLAAVPALAEPLADAQALLESWLTAVRRGRPWTTVKWAQSLDARAAAADGSSRWITGPAARADVHRRRAEADAILTGTGTVLADDPELTARGADGALLPHQPRPIVVGGRAVPASAKLRTHPAGLVEAGRAPLPDVLARAYADGARRVLVEAGPGLTSTVLRAGLADELVAYVAPVLIGGPVVTIGDLGVASIDQAIRLQLRGVERLGDDLALTLRPMPVAKEGQ